MKEITVKIPPTNGWLEYKLNKKELDYVWRCVENQKGDYKHSLAGNIEASNLLLDRSDWFFRTTVRPLIIEYEKQFGCLGNNFPSNQRFEYHMNTWWVNYQKKNEFNPVHNHGGIYSFVLWLKIPTTYFEQNKKLISLKSNAPSISNFEFLYTDTLGWIRNFPYEMNPDKEGMLLFFPAHLKHQVYPFYDCDETRISVSGNVQYNTTRVLHQGDDKLGAL